MTDNEIIKALECCSHRNEDLPCDGCPAYNIAQMCMEDLMSDALDLINRQKAEIERLENDFVNVTKIAKSEEVKEFDEKLIIQQGLIDYQKAEIEKLKQENEFFRKTITENAQRALEVTVEEIETSKSEAIKEFAHLVIDRSRNGVIYTSDIPDLVKEMTEV